jgi:hypothetical protein
VIREVRQQGFDKSWVSHKFNGLAVKYEVATCIKTGDIGEIVWIHGPFPGAKHDLTIFHSKLAWMLHPLKWTWGELGYIGLEGPKHTMKSSMVNSSILVY